MKAEGDTVSISLPTGAAYSAKLGGPQALVTGDAGWTSVSVARAGANTIVENDYRDGKLVNVLTMAVSPDGTKLTMKTDDRLRNRSATYILNKQ